MQLIVVGMHRSGTSVLARLLNLMGAYFAPEGMGTGANEENPKGFWERRDVRALNDFVLHGAGCDWDRVSRFDTSAIPAPLLAEFDKRATQIVLSMDANRPWFMKEPRLCLLLPLWRRVLEAPVVIHILRHPIEVASSLRTRNKIPMEAGLALWEVYNRSAAAGMEGLPRVVVQHRRLMQEPMAAVAALHAQLEAMEVRGLRRPTATEVASFVSRELYREREGQRGLDAYADAPQLKLFELWSANKALPKGDRGLPPKERDVLAAYEASLPPLAPNPAVPKKPTETELHEKIAAGEREARTLKEQVQHVQALLEQRERQATFVEAEFTALRDAHAARESAAAEIAAGLKRLLLEREAWFQEKDRGAEAERTRLTEEICRLAGKLEAATAASATREGRLAGEVRRAVASQQELEAQRRANAENAAARENELSTEIESLRAEIESLRAERDASRAAMEVARESDSAREQALQTEVDVARATLAAAVDTRDMLQAQVSEGSRELTQLTRLYLGAARTNTHLQARVVAIRAEADTYQRDHVALIEQHARESETFLRKQSMLTKQHDQMSEALSDRLAESEHALTVRQDEAALLRDVSALYASELACMEQRLVEIQAGASRALTAPLRRLRAWFGRHREGAPVDAGSSLSLLHRSPWFDAGWYTSQYHDVAVSGLAPEAHYLVRGAVEARNPSPGFDTRHYLASNPDVADSGQNPLLHFIRHGENEGRSPAPKRGSR